MSVCKKIKKILLLTGLVELEEEEFCELDRKYSIEFAKDFRKENLYLRKLEKK